MQLHVKQLATSGAASGEVLAFNGTNWAPATAPNGAIGGTITGATAGSVLFAGVAGVLAQDNANLFWNNTDNHLYIGSTSPTIPSVLSITGGTLSGTARAIYADGTLSTTANQFMATFDATTGGSTGAIFKGNLSANLLAGYTGSGGTVAGSFTNAAAGTGSWLILTNPGYSAQLGNAGIVSVTRGTTAGTNLAGHFGAEGSSASNTGILAVSTNSLNSPLQNYGVLAFAAGGSSANIAGVFSLNTGTSLTSSAALIADVGAVTGPIFIGREAGSNVAVIGEHGTLALTPTASHGEHVIAAVGGTLASGKKIFNATATLADANVSAVEIVATTSSGTSASSLTGFNVQLYAGYTGSGSSYAIYAYNDVQGTGATPLASLVGQFGAAIQVEGSATTGTRVGIMATSANSTTRNFALVGQALSSSGSPGNIGVYGHAASFGGSPALVGGMFTLYGKTDSIGTLTSAALIADNASVAAPIFIARDSGTDVLTIKDGGDVDHFVSKNGVLSYEMRNVNAGGNAEVSFYANAGGTSFSAFKQLGTNFTTIGLRVANQMNFYSEAGNTGGILFNSMNSSAPIVFTTGGDNATFERFRMNSTGSVFNDNAQDADLRIEGSGTRPDLFLVDAGTARVGINRAAGTHAATLDVDNLAVAEPILNLRDNGSVVFGVIDGGSVEMAEISAPATPAANFGRLYVKTKAATNSIYYKDDGGTEFDLTAGSFGIGGTVTSATAGSVLFAGAASVLAQDNANLFWDDTNNRLGIGTATPSYPIHVAASAAAPRYISIENSSASGDAGLYAANTNDTTYIQQTVYGSTTSAGNVLGISRAGVAEIQLRPAAGARAIVYTSAAQDLVLGTNDVARVYITSGGNVDIGGTGAANKLVVTADGTAGTPAIALGATADSNTGFFHPAADTLALSTGGTERMRWDDNGNVGIGLTATSGYKLHVGGSNVLLTNTGTNANTFFQLYDSASLTNSNYILFGVDTSGATTGYSGQGAFMSTGANGTGTVRDLILHNFNNAGIVLASNNTERGRMTGGGTWQLAAATGHQTLATSPAQLTANQNDYNPGTGVYFRLSSDASRDITGIANGVDGRRITLVNVGTNDIVLKNNDAGSTAANRLLTGTGADVTLGADDSAELIYDATTSRWRFTSIKL
jgi:hypothetical protein